MPSCCCCCCTHRTTGACKVLAGPGPSGMGSAQSGSCVMQELKDLCKRLLVHAPSQRLCMGKNGVADLMQHPWFAGFDWARFKKQELVPPYKPKVRAAA